ncbi:MAG: hypothetical protein ACYTGZ_16205 [Planctomycetota bacterium]
MAVESLAWTLRDVFAPGLVYDPVPCFAEPGWLPSSRDVLDGLSGGQIALAGDYPVICHRSASTPAIRRLLQDVGYPEAQRLIPYETEAEYQGVLAQCATDGTRIAVGHAHAEAAMDPASYWIPRDLLCALNDKGNLGDLVPPGSLPQRTRLSADEFRALAAGAAPLPAAVKVASPLSSGAGFGVKLCRTPDDWADAQREFSGSPHVVVEEWLEIRSIWCAGFILRPPAPPRYIGAAEQVAKEDGRYQGNWISVREVTPEPVVRLGRSMAVAAAERGYDGICGFDIVVCADGSVKAIDANFRFNGSSLPLALRPWMNANNAALARSLFWSFDGPFAEMDRTIRAAVARGHFLPYSMWDGGDSPSRVSGIVVGGDREEITARIDGLARDGLR